MLSARWVKLTLLALLTLVVATEDSAELTLPFGALPSLLFLPESAGLGGVPPRRPGRWLCCWRGRHWQAAAAA